MRCLLICVLSAACTSGGSGGGHHVSPLFSDGGNDSGSGTSGDALVGDAARDSGSGSTVGLTFGVVGDTRPANPNDTANYPTAIITQIYKDLQAASPQPQLVVATGDYQFADTTSSEQQPQIDLYMTARAGYSGPLWPAMGNHECTGYTSSNCGSGNTSGVTTNMTVFLNTMLAPLGQTLPYYSENLAASDGSWTAKFIFVACNAWDSTQATWLSSVLAQTTTYTFVMRHESAADMSEAQCSESQTLVAANPLTLLIVGHTHEYSHVAASKEIVNGLGGAPITGSQNYGYTIVSRGANGTLTVTTYDYQSGAAIDSFSINADGSPA